ncbi:ASFV G ACD 00330 [African swine fever virus]
MLIRGGVLIVLRYKFDQNLISYKKGTHQHCSFKFHNV